MESLTQLLAGIKDHRKARGIRYPFASMIKLVVLGFMCGRNHLSGVARLAKALSHEEREMLGFNRFRVPSHATLCIFFWGMDVDTLETALGRLCVRGTAEHLAMDGKRLRASVSDTHEGGVHLLSCFSDRLKSVAGQTQQREGTNEITAALDLLNSLELKDATITGDAIFAQKEICNKIVEKGGDFVFAVKDNQAALKRRVKAATEAAAISLSPSGRIKRKRRKHV